VRIPIPRTAAASAALLTAVGIGIAIAGPAAASASPALADSSSGDIAIGGTMPGADTDCTHVWTGSGNQAFNGTDASSWVEWTSNSCGWSIEERSWCVSTVTGSGTWETSGVVEETGHKDSTYCPDGYDITRGEERTSSDGGSTWTTYETFWTP
jgi:hypothetical protein